MNGPDPRRALGALGERLARAHLEARGLIVLDANYRTRHGELDLVALDERSLIFCEVKTRVSDRAWARRGTASERDRGTELGPFAGIDSRKRRRLRLMARQWLARYGSDAPWRPELRFDAVAVELDADGRLLRLDHMEGAF